MFTALTVHVRRAINRSRGVRALAMCAVTMITLTSCQDSTSPAATGGIALTFDGLPGGATGSVRLTHGSKSRVVNAAETVEGLEAGEWTLVASPVTVDGLVYDPQPASQTVNVPARSIGSARVVWTPTTGSIDLSVLGLPAGMNADVLVAGPGVSRVVASSTMINALAPGAYTITARDVRAPAGTYRATLLSQSVTVAASAIPATATVSYALAPATVDIVVNGLPASTPASITLAPPNGGAVQLTGSTRLASVTAGRWQLVASTVQANGATYSPSPATRDTTVSAGDTLRFTVNYALTTGSLAVAITGLPGGAAGKVLVTGPGGYSFALTNTTTLTDLVPGTYTVAADSVVRDGFAWRATPASQQVVVTPSLTAAPATVSYVSVSGTLVITVSGVPSGVAGSVRITGPYGFDRTVETRTVFTPTATGEYTITAASIVHEGVRYDVSPATVTRTVTIGSRDSVDMRYENLSGSLALTVEGLPDGVPASMTLVGDAQTISLTGSATVPNLSPGTYRLSANIVTVGNTAYAPSLASQNFNIAPRAQTSLTLVYSITNLAIDFVLDQAYFTQATQRFDGSVPLVAGRDALLRVFAHADRANSIQPPVRALIYDGSTLLQTAMLNAPSSGVPLTLTENVYSSTWNVVVPGANVRTGLRVVVEIDPTNAIDEADETNNRWPRGGSSESITVTTVPPFTVRFVPITVGGKSGNVTAGNMNAFLLTARKVWPLLDVNSSVRAPFTSSADTLVSDDSNNRWGTVLSEMNTLRVTDGAGTNTHYYGVLKVGYNSGVAGYGYVPGRAAIGWDYQPSGDGVAAHEWGHNFNRPHAPCGGAAGADPSFPYSAGNIGVYGWNSATNQILNPSTRDLMGYCNPNWISDFNWTRAMTYRQISGVEAAALSTNNAPTEGLLVWGRIVNGTVLLEPAFRVRAPITPAAALASHHVEALDGDGAVLLDLPIVADRVDHSTSQSEQHFAVVMPWSATLERALSRIRVRDVRTPLVAASRVSSTAVAAKLSRNAILTAPLVMPDPEATVDAAPAGRARVRWNSARYPMAMVRDAITGQIMGYVRKSGDAVVTGGRTLEVEYSDGVRSVTQRRRP